jgi:peptidoglycan-associated lipoprotein
MKTRLLIASLLMVTMSMLGCARKPATAVSSVPAPASASSSARMAGVAAGQTPAAQAATAQTGSGRPAPAGYATASDLREILFDFDKYAIRPHDAQILDGNARWLRANPRDLLLVEGHCDERGTAEYNLALGDRRAKAAMDYLVAQGIVAGRITVLSYGKERPVCRERNEACWAKNRRAHFLVKRG